MDRAFYKTYFEVEKNHWWFRVRRNLIFSLMKKYDVQKSNNIFDFGCGSGFLVGFLQSAGFDVSGSDMSAEAIDFGKSKGVKNLYTSSEVVKMEKEKNLDVVLALDVLEHIRDDALALQNIERSLKPGGLAIITVPAYMWLWGVQDEISNHYRRYTTSNLVKIVSRSGDFKIVKKSYFNTFLFPGVVLVRFLSKVFGLKERESDFDINNKFLNGVFYFIFNLESKLLRFINFPFGVSILLVLRKTV